MNTGLDPELLTVTPSSFIIPAALFLPPPVQLPGSGGLNKLSFDNAAAEFRPSHTANPWRLTGRLQDLFKSAVAQLQTGKSLRRVHHGARFTLAPSAPLLDKYRFLDSVSTFGCSPSLLLGDDYGIRATVPSVSAISTAHRSAGFHIHNELPFPTAQASVAVMDGLLGLLDVLANANMDFLPQSRIRRGKLGYGRAGEHRVRTGRGFHTVLEYRTLSPWPFISPQMTHDVVTLARGICGASESRIMKILDQFPERSRITAAINDGEATIADALFDQCVSVWESHGGGSTAWNIRLAITKLAYRNNRRRTDFTFIKSWRK